MCVCARVCMLHSIKTEPGRVHILFTATCFTSGLKMGAVFHSEIGSLTLKVCVCVGLCVLDRRRLTEQSSRQGDSGALSYNPLVPLKYIIHALQPIPDCHVVLASHWRIAI